jgi:hypothetical protein
MDFNNKLLFQEYVIQKLFFWNTLNIIIHTHFLLALKQNPKLY